MRIIYVTRRAPAERKRRKREYKKIVGRYVQRRTADNKFGYRFNLKTEKVLMQTTFPLLET